MTVSSLLQRLDNAQPVVAYRDMYLTGSQPLRFMSDHVDEKVMRFNSNLAKVAVRSVASRMRLRNVAAAVDGRDVSGEAQRLVQDADLPMTLQSILMEVLGLGSAYLLVWVDEFGRPVVTGESARHMAVERDPITNSVVEAIKRWQAVDANGVVTEEHVVHYTRSRIVHLTRDASQGKLSFRSAVDNPLGVVPVVPLINVERIGDHVGGSVIDDLAPLVDALNKLIVDMMVASEATSKPKRFATGVVLEDDDEGGFIADEGFSVDDDEPEFLDDSQGVKSPFKDSDDMWLSEQAEAKFGQLPGADLKGYQTAVDIIVQQIMAVTSLPAHMVGITTANPSTAEALRASEVSLSDSAKDRLRVVSRPLEWAIRLLVAIAQGVPPGRVSVDLEWEDTATRSIAQEADAASKLKNEEVITEDDARRLVGAGEEI
ncbi:phage portal protein [Corynebacterium ammoniagenes]|uniref:phage portal protein n=1 Tax=Corynebacterium ammoniagenes TaxID=1697 RepID=UPI00145955F0|nr:phage portal protein [Corynebacterium ammoniagenes]NMF32283.1 phage portal protein [Corynebacterium ammoniagenes]